MRSYKRNQAADSERNTRWKRGPVNWTPTSLSPRESESQTWTTRPCVAKSASLFLAAEKRFPFAEPPRRSGWARREPYCVKGIRISRSQPMATSKRVTKAAPLRQRFSLEVSSSKAKPRESRPLIFSGKRTAILRSERCLETVVLASGTMGWVLISGSGPVLEKAFDTFENFRGRARRMYNSTKLAAVSHAMSKPASELLHFAHTTGQVGSINLLIVVH